MFSCSHFTGQSKSFSIWLETTNLQGGLNHDGNNSKIHWVYIFARLRKGFVQGHAIGLSLPTPIGFLLVGPDADDSYWPKDIERAFPNGALSYCRMALSAFACRWILELKHPPVVVCGRSHQIISRT
jgi:hypothetical protein